MEELSKQIEELFKEWAEQHQIFLEKGNKSAEKRARKALTKLRDLVPDYRKYSVALTN